MADRSEKLLTIPLPDGRVARVPLSLLEQHVDQDARSCHYQGPAQASVRDVVAHHVAVDDAGVSDWHVDWELGPCTVKDTAGFPVEYYAWHRHPLGTDYAELYEVS